MFMLGDLLAVYTMQWTVLSGFPLMTAFCCIYLIFTFWRDFVILSILTFATDTLKIALSYRLGSSFLDMLAVFVMSFVCLAMLMPRDQSEDQTLYMGIVVSKMQLEELEDSEFETCFLILFINVLS